MNLGLKKQRSFDELRAKMLKQKISQGKFPLDLFFFVLYTKTVNTFYKEKKMPTEMMGYLSAFVYGILCIVLGIILYKFGVPKKYTRKTVHILVGFEWAILYHFFGATIHTLVVCLAFTLLLIVTYFGKMLPAMSSDSDNAPGTVYYGVSMSIMAVISLFVPKMMIPFGIGVFVTSFGDGFAGVIGQACKKYNPKIFKKKSLLGTLANFIFSFLVCEVFKYIFELPLSHLSCIFIAVFAVGLELIGLWGLDNIIMTVGISFLSYGLIYHYDVLVNFIVPILLTPFVVTLVTEKKALTQKGLCVAMILDLVVSLTLANFGFTLLLSFLVFSIIVDKIKKKKKAEDTITKKGECRDEIQVIANGLVCAVVAIMFAITRNHVFVVAYIAALSEAFADTVASGFGVYAKNTYDVFKFRKGTCGLSGGMSLIGTFASLVAAVLFSLIAIPFGVADIYLCLIAATAAFFGVIFDSFLGSLFQVKYRCEVCSSLTEREEHCNKPCVKHSGFVFFDNDVVNIFSGVFAAAVSVGIYFIFV